MSAPIVDLMRPVVLVTAVALLAACAKCGPPAASTEAERSAVKAVSAAWKSAYNSGDAAAVSALYTEDAVLSAPGEPPVLGRAAISAYFVRKVAEFSAAGVTVEDAPLGDVVASGDLAWQWQTYRVVNKSGAVADEGKLVTLFQRRNGRWVIAGDTWNSDSTSAPPTKQDP